MLELQALEQVYGFSEMYTFWKRILCQAWAWFFFAISALRRNVVMDRLHSRAAALPVISPRSHRRRTSSKFSGSGFLGRPNCTPRCLTASIPYRCRLRMFSRSLCATNERICSTMSAMNVPIRSFPCRVSSSGMSSTQMSAPISLVSLRHWL